MSASIEDTIKIDKNIRINKYICASGACSRKTADDWVRRGDVRINGKLAKLGDLVVKNDSVTVNGKQIKPLNDDQVIFIAFNKPVGVVCTAAKTDHRNIVDFIDHQHRIFPVGRLDKDSQGLIFLTNKSDLVDKISNAGNRHEKEYLVTVNKKVTSTFIENLCNGVPILGLTTKACIATKESKHVFRIILTQGLNRQIRRMCKHHGYVVKKLERVRIMHISLHGLANGQWRNLSVTELSTLYQALE